MDSIYKSFFERYQKELLEVSNSDSGRSLFQIPQREKIVKIVPNGYFIEIEKNIFQGFLRCYDLYAGIVAGNSLIKRKKLKKESSILPFISRKSRSFDPFFYLPMAVDFYAAAGDGVITRAVNPPTTWADQRDDATSASHDHTSGAVATGSMFLFGTDRYLRRLFFPVDTSSINGTITAATLKIYTISRTAVGTGENQVICKMQLATATEIVDGDYDGYDSLDTPAEWSSRVAHTTPTLSAYHSWIFNATGIAQISKTGVTHCGMRSSRDIDNDDPDSLDNYTLEIATSEASGTSTDPFLTVMLAGGGALFGF